ncbi:hypothetical protein [Streptomyces sp. S465]|uniref:hypothetical protein n=1 Tax=Streptomyces sp. S465 TaxID=2979468 RepID=UPI0022A821F6|nr:hypothetical protein [Streptomyces sp. S465]WAP54955.1 hypothetical protein N6H00_08085 [Streptomyces sp. S465]
MARPESAESSTGWGTPATLPKAPLMAACSGGSHSSCTRAGGQLSVPSAVGAWVSAVIEKDAKQACLLPAVPGSGSSRKAATTRCALRRRRRRRPPV